MNVTLGTLRRACGVLAAAILAGPANCCSAQTVLVDFGSDASYRGLSVVNPDANGDYWTSVQPGILTPLVDVANQATTMQIGWDTPVGTDSYNGPAGPTDESTLETDVLNTNIDAVALGNLGGSLEAAFDFAAGYNGVDHFPVRLQIQGLNPAATYTLTFFGSHAFSNDATTVYTIYTDDTYTAAAASTTLDVQDPDIFFEPNRDRVATIQNVAPQTDAILYLEFVGMNGFGGYLNALQIVANSPAFRADFNGDGNVDGTDLGEWTGDFGQTGGGVADATGDMLADGADLLIWQQELTVSGATTAIGVVPEPATRWLLLFGAGGFAVRRR